MRPYSIRYRFIAAMICLVCASSSAQAQNPPPTPSPQPAPAEADQPLLNEGQLDALVAPIALYPDPLLSQVLMASTYPLEVVQAERWGRERGADRLVVTTALHRADAPPFYEALGFEHTGRRYVRRFD